MPNYVAYLYRKCLEIDKANEYVFFQPNQSRTLGPTLLAPTRPGLAGAAQFDCFAVQRLIRQAKVEIFHGPGHILPWRRIAGVKYVVTIHDLATRVLPSHYGWKHRWYYRWLVPHSIQLADAVVADSFNTKADILRFSPVPAERIHVVHLAVGEHILRAMETPAQRLLPEKYFLSVTTHPKRKNVLGALEAFATFASRNRELNYVIAGLIGPEQQQELYAQAERFGIRDRVRLFGYADDAQLINLYRYAEFLMYPSFYEGFGLPVVEAMACGCPVVASDASSLPEIVPDKQWLADPHSIQDMADKMQRLLALRADQREALIQQSQKHAQTFTWERAARQMMEIYKDLGHS